LQRPFLSFVIKWFSNIHFVFFEFAVCDVLTAEITMRRAQSPNTWQKRQYRAGILGRQNAVRKVSQKSESLSDVSFVDNSWFFLRNLGVSFFVA
jgi:hypothetical protein